MKTISGPTKYRRRQRVVCDWMIASAGSQLNGIISRAKSEIELNIFPFTFAASV